MYITITDIMSEKRIDLADPIKNFNNKEVAVVSVFSDKIRYEFTEPHNAELGLRNKLIKPGTYARRELIDLVEGKLK